MISMEELVIAIHTSALDAMQDRAAMLHRRRLALEEEIEILSGEIQNKQQAISAARDVWLRRCV